MQGAYGGLVVILIYATGEQASQDDMALFTEDGLPMLTEASDDILVEQ